MTIRVVLADDQSLLRKGFRMILEAEDDFSVVGEAADGAAAVRLVELYQPDVVLMDVRMPTLDGIEATRAITASGSLCHVLILTTFDLDAYALPIDRRGERIPPDGRSPARADAGDPHHCPRRCRGLAPRHQAFAPGVFAQPPRS